MEKCILLFVKYPEKGKVKTRLARDIGQDSALILYKIFVLDILEKLSACAYNLIIYYYPLKDDKSVRKWLGDGYFYAPQNGETLGERMKNAFERIFSEGFSRVVIIGSDIPDISVELMNEAFTELDKHDAVIGPSYDGGYYLIGLKKEKFLPEIFKGIEWSTEKVFNDTMRIFRKNRYNVYLLPELQDIDTIDDLKAFYERNKANDFRNSKTMKLILDLKDSIILSDSSKQPVLQE